MSRSKAGFERAQAAELARRLAEARRFIQVAAGPRQVGKSTLVGQVFADEIRPSLLASADAPGLPRTEWIVQQWEAARLPARDGGKAEAVPALDEIQKVPA